MQFFLFRKYVLILYTPGKDNLLGNSSLNSTNLYEHSAKIKGVRTKKFNLKQFLKLNSAMWQEIGRMRVNQLLDSY